MNSFLKIESPEDLSTFLNEHLVFQTFLWELKDGKVDYLKTPKNEYTNQFPSGIAHKFEQGLRRSLLWTRWRLSQDILFHHPNPIDISRKTLNGDGTERFLKAKPYMKALEILTVGKNDQHYENYATIGVYYELEKEYEKSLKYYKESLSIINRDPNLDISEHPWKDIIVGIHQHIERVKSKM